MRFTQNEAEASLTGRYAKARRVAEAGIFGGRQDEFEKQPRRAEDQYRHEIANDDRMQQPRPGEDKEDADASRGEGGKRRRAVEKPLGHGDEPVGDRIEARRCDPGANSPREPAENPLRGKTCGHEDEKDEQQPKRIIALQLAADLAATRAISDGNAGIAASERRRCDRIRSKATSSAKSLLGCVCAAAAAWPRPSSARRSISGLQGR